MVKQIESNQWWSGSIIRVVGYGLILLTLFDVISAFIPPRFTNAGWEYQTVGNLVERSPIPLLGLMLVLFGGMTYRKPWEIFTLKFLSWCSLLVGILYFLLIPLALSSALRVNNQNQVQLSAKARQQLAQLQRIEQQVSQAKDKDISQLIDSLKAQGLAPNVELKNPQDLKSQLLAKLPQARKSIQEQAESALRDSQINLLKNAVKWILEALVSGILFIITWKLSWWTRSDVVE